MSGFICTIKFLISVTSLALDPSPVINCHTFSPVPLTLERDVLYGQPQQVHEDYPIAYTAVMNVTK